MNWRDSWEVWRGKVNQAIGNVEEIDADEIVYDNTTSGLTATNVQSAIDEVAGDVDTLTTTVGDASSGIVKDVTDLKAKKYVCNELWHGDASGGTTKEITTLANYDELMIYYNNGGVVARMSAALLIANTGVIRCQYTNNGSTYEAVLKVVDSTHVTCTASQGSTYYLYGIKYHS